MAFTEAEIADHLETIETEFWSRRRPPLHLRDQLREGQRFVDQAIDLYFERPVFRRPGESVEEPIARIRYVRVRETWCLYWQRADLKWHGYEPCPETPSLSEALAVIDEDEHACFFG